MLPYIHSKSEVMLNYGLQKFHICVLEPPKDAYLEFYKQKMFPLVTNS